MNPPYIVFEGMDGAGKTTLANAVHQALRDRGRAVARLTMPGRMSAAGRLIRQVLDENMPMAPRGMVWLFAAELADLDPKIREMRDENVTIVCDRHTLLSMAVYQAPLHGSSLVYSILRHIEPVLPTHMYVIDIPVAIALQRRRDRGKAQTRFYEDDDREKLEDLRKRYLHTVMSVGEEITVLDGTIPIDDLVARVLSDLEVG